MKQIGSNIKFIAVSLLITSVIGFILASINEFNANTFILSLSLIISNCTIVYALGVLIEK